jgi:tetratricopeptide (TPR) repeat protein
MVRRSARTRPSTLEPIALLFATLLAYYPAWHGGVLWDDNAHLTRPELQSTVGLWRIWFDIGATQQYYPVTHSAFWFMHRLWGDATIGYHLVNIVLHVSSAWLVAVILRRLDVPGAVLAAVLFALHPIQVESVAWMTELKNTLSGLYYLGAGLFYLRFDERRRTTDYVAALLLFVVALLTKTVAAMLTPALLVVFWWKRGRIDLRRDVRPLVPFFVLGMSAGLVTAWFERSLNGARGIEFQLGPLDRLLIAGRAIWFYALKLLWPARLSFIYARWEIDRTAWQQYLYPTAVAGVLTIGWLVRNKSRAPLAAALIFCGTLMPALGFFDVYPFRYAFVADHFQYLASIALFAAFSAAVITALERGAIGGRRVELACCLVLGIPLSTLTWNQSRQYTDENTLYRATLERNPACWLCHNNLATPLLHGSRTDLDAAIDHLRESLRINPLDAEAHNNMGGAYQRLGRYEDALKEHQAALRLNPQLVEARYNMGLCAQALNRLDEARVQYVEAIRAQPDYALAHYNLGTTLTAMARPDEAGGEFREAIRLTPEFAPAHDALGLVLLKTGQIPDAVSEFKTATRIQPDYVPAHYNLAVTLAAAGLLDEALEEFRDAVRYAPTSAEMHQALGAALAGAGKFSDAETELREAIRLRPDDQEARANLEAIKRVRK